MAERVMKKLDAHEIDYLSKCFSQPYNVDSLVPVLTEGRQLIDDKKASHSSYSHIKRTEDAERKRFVGQMEQVLAEVQYWDSRRMQFPIKRSEHNPYKFVEIRYSDDKKEIKCPAEIELIRLCKAEQTYFPHNLVKPFRSLSTAVQIESGFPLSSEILGRLARDDLYDIIEFSRESGYKWWIMAEQRTKNISGNIRMMEHKPLMFVPGACLPIPTGVTDDGKESAIPRTMADFTKRCTRTWPVMLSS